MASRSHDCSVCGAKAEAGPFCRMCGLRLVEADDSTGGRAHVFGRPPGVLASLSTAQIVVAAVLLALAVLLFAVGARPFAVALLLIVVAAVWVLGSTERRRTGLRAASNLRGQARYAAHSVRSWSRAGREVVSLRRQLHALEARRRAAVYALGEAALSADEDRVGAASQEVVEIDERRDELAARIEQVVAGTRDEIGVERLTIQPTQIISPGEEPSKGDGVERG